MVLFAGPNRVYKGSGMLNQTQVTLMTSNWLTETRVTGTKSVRLRNQVVKQVQVGQRPPISLPSWAGQGGMSGRHVMYVPLASARRLEVFLNTIYHRRRDSWDCFSFANFFMGLSGDQFLFPANTRRWNRTVSAPNRTKHGREYVIMRGGQPMHAVIGFLRPNLTLGVLGVGNDLILARCDDLMKVYGGDELHEVTGAR